MPSKSDISERASPQSDQHECRLLAQVARQDRRAFEQLFFAYYQRLLRFSLRMVSRQTIAEEVVNDVMLVVWNKAHTFAGNSRVSTWIFGITYRTSLKALRRQRVMSVFVQNQTVIDQASVDGDYGVLEDQQWLSKGFHALSLEQRAVVELTYYSGYGYADIAEILGCPENTVKTRMFHARKKLKAYLPTLVTDAPVSTRNNNERP